MTTDDTSTTTRDRLLASAIEVFMEKGYARTRVQEIAKNAGLTTGAIYSNFDDKASLLAEAIVRSAGSALQAPAGSGRGSGDPLLDATKAAVGGKARPSDRLVLEALVAGVHEEDARAMLPEALGGLLEPLQAAVAGAGIDADLNDEAVLGVLRAIVLGGMVAKAAGLGDVSPAGAETVLSRMLDGLRKGGGKKATGKVAADAPAAAPRARSTRAPRR